MAGIYIHIPFCKQACVYCNFYFSTSLSNKDKFVKALIREIELTQLYLQDEKIETIYFGGGTPSLLTINDFYSIISSLETHYDLKELSEFTIEANPDDLSKEKVDDFRKLKNKGFNRPSIGVQSFFDEDLQYMGRAHNAGEALSGIKRVQDAGFENITIDLIYGTPTMNDERWQANLNRTFELGIPHISSYALTVEEKTTLDRKIKKGESKPVDEEQSARQFVMLMEEIKKAGYEQYEISNFCKPGRHAIHNSNYWFGKKYLGLGPSAHSFNGVARRWNISNNVNYIRSIDKGELPFEEEILTEAQQVNEKIMTGLRTKWGINMVDLGFLPAGRQGEIADLIQKNLEAVEPAFYNLENGTLTLTDKGKLFADKIAASLFI